MIVPPHPTSLAGTEHTGRAAESSPGSGYDYIDGGITAVPLIGREHAYVLYSSANRASFERDKKLLAQGCGLPAVWAM